MTPADDDEAVRESTVLSVSALYGQLCGNWQLQRIITSHATGLPSGTFKGTATFSPIEQKGSDQAGDSSLYLEEGMYTSNPAMMPPFHASRRYIYALEQDMIAVYFVKADGISKDYLFHKIELPEEAEDKDETARGGVSVVRARSEHLCVQDLYKVHYHFLIEDGRLKHFVIEYKVQGPKKDYVMVGQYSRGEPVETVVEEDLAS